jgi:hypothetical protein
VARATITRVQPSVGCMGIFVCTAIKSRPQDTSRIQAAKVKIYRPRQLKVERGTLVCFVYSERLVWATRARVRSNGDCQACPLLVRPVEPAKEELMRKAYNGAVLGFKKEVPE